MRCRELLQRLSDYIDRDLDPRLCRHIESHMKGCRPCIAFIATLKKTVGVLHFQRKARLSSDLKAELRRRLGCYTSRMPAKKSGSLTHDLMTPLTSIKGYAEALLGGALEDKKERREFVKVILRNAEDLERLIRRRVKS